MPVTSSVRELARAVVPERVRTRMFYLLEDNPLFRRLHGEVNFIEAQLAGLSGRPWNGFADPGASRGMTERVVEMPWALSRWDGEQHVLDIGSAFALRVWVRHLTSLGIADLHGVDLATRAVPGMTVHRADVRSLPFPDDTFELAFCISTLEHVGQDNTANYHLASSSGQEAGDVAALRELHRVLRPQGRLLVSVPFGRAQQLGWQKQYDVEDWTATLAQTPLREAERTVFAYSDAGWGVAGDGVPLPSAGYRDLGAPAATGVLCAVLTKP